MEMVLGVTVVVLQALVYGLSTFLDYQGLLVHRLLLEPSRTTVVVILICDLNL